MPKYYKVNDHLDLKLNSNEIITIELNSHDVTLNYDLQNADYSILIFNNFNNDINLIESGSIINSNVNITYIDLNNYKFNQNNSINVYSNSTLNINSIYLGINTKEITFDLTNKEKDSKVYINNNVVCLNDADFVLNVIGNIVKGAKRSICKQKSNCLTFESPKRSKILPVLNIDENDVEAAHALSSGTIDEEVLFYMNSRGLTKKESLSLLLMSYLLPNDEFYSIYENGKHIKNEANKKVNDLCLM